MIKIGVELDKLVLDFPRLRDRVAEGPSTAPNDSCPVLLRRCHKTRQGARPLLHPLIDALRP